MLLVKNIDRRYCPRSSQFHFLFGSNRVPYRKFLFYHSWNKMGKVKSYLWRPEDVTASLLSHSTWPSHLWVQLPCICCSSLLRSDHSGHILVWSQACPSCWGLGRWLPQQGGTSGGRFVRGCPECAVAARWGRTWQVTGIKRYNTSVDNTKRTPFPTQTQLCGNHWQPWDASELVSYGNRRTHVLSNEGFESRRKRAPTLGSFQRAPTHERATALQHARTHTQVPLHYNSNCAKCLHTQRLRFQTKLGQKQRRKRWYLCVYMRTPGS